MTVQSKLTLAQLEAELSRRLSGSIASTDTTTLDAALNRAVRFIGSLCSYTFLQKTATITFTAGSATLPTDLDFSKEVKLYFNNIRLQCVPWTELATYQSFTTLMPTAFAYDPAGNLKVNSAIGSPVSATIYYSKVIETIATNGHTEIPTSWHDIILDVAEFQQKELYRQVYSEEAKANTIERLKQFVREFNATQEANININDEMIRKGA